MDFQSSPTNSDSSDIPNADPQIINEEEEEMKEN
jgi:hypothetical protein